MDFQGAQSQKEGQEDEGRVEELGGPPGSFKVSWSS